MTAVPAQVAGVDEIVVVPADSHFCLRTADYAATCHDFGITGGGTAAAGAQCGPPDGRDGCDARAGGRPDRRPGKPVRRVAK